ncbi:hypothetical protein ACFSQ7_44425 [Paenibacillus rhizoplanae]
MNKKWMTLGILIIMASVLLTSCDKKNNVRRVQHEEQNERLLQVFTGTEEKKLSMKKRRNAQHRLQIQGGRGPAVHEVIWAG